MFLTELCAALSLSPSEPASTAHGTNAFLSVWRVRSTTPDDMTTRSYYRAARTISVQFAGRNGVRSDYG